MAYHGGRYFGPRYFGPRYWGSQQVELPPGFISGTALGAATANGNLTALGHMTASSAGLAVAVATLTAGGWMTGSAHGFATVTGTLTAAGGPVDPPASSVGTGSGGGPAKRRRKKKRRLTVEEQLEIARLRGTLRKLEDIFSAPERSLLPSWEEMKNEWEIEEAPVEAKRSAKPGPAFMIPETDSFEKISDASRRVVEQLLAEARSHAAATEARRQELLKQIAEDDDEDDIELLLLDLL